MCRMWKRVKIENKEGVVVIKGKYKPKIITKYPFGICSEHVRIEYE